MQLFDVISNGAAISKCRGKFSAGLMLASPTKQVDKPMVTTDQELRSNVQVGQAVPELQWGMTGVPHSSFLTQLSAPGKLLHSIIFSLLSTKPYSWGVFTALHIHFTCGLHGFNKLTRIIQYYLASDKIDQY